MQDEGFADLGYFFTLTKLELLNLASIQWGERVRPGRAARSPVVGSSVTTGEPAGAGRALANPAGRLVSAPLVPSPPGSPCPLAGAAAPPPGRYRLGTEPLYPALHCGWLHPGCATP